MVIFVSEFGMLIRRRFRRLKLLKAVRMQLQATWNAAGLFTLDVVAFAY
jgi:hypothetical protein